MDGLRQVFGEDALSRDRIKSCKFHFKESMLNKMARKLGQEAGETFKELCKIFSNVI